MPFSNIDDTFDWDTAACNFSVADIMQAPSSALPDRKFLPQQGYDVDQFLDFGFAADVNPLELEQPAASGSTSPLNADFALSNDIWSSPAADFLTTPTWTMSPVSAQSPTPSLSEDSAHSDAEESTQSNKTANQRHHIIQTFFSTAPTESKVPASSRHASPSAASKPKHSTNTKSPIHKSTTARRRLPHNQVERKYREGLNQQLDNLRRAVPTLLPATDTDGNPISVKTSKAAVLATAIEYIKAIEAERDSLQRQVEILKGIRV